MLPVYVPDAVHPLRRTIPRLLGLAFVLGLVFTVAGVVFGIQPAWAETVKNDISTPGSGLVQIDPAVLAFLTGSLMPLLTGLLTKLSTTSAVKAVLNLVLSVAVGVLAAFVANPDHTLTYLEIATAAILAWTGSGIAYGRFWKPVGATTKLQQVGPIK